MAYEREIQFPDIELNQLQLNYKWHSFRSNVAIDFVCMCAPVCNDTWRQQPTVQSE